MRINVGAKFTLVNNVVIMLMMTTCNSITVVSTNNSAVSKIK